MKTKLIESLWMVLLLVSCQQEVEILQSALNTERNCTQEVQTHQKEVYTGVSENEAKVVAELFKSKETATRSSLPKIGSIQTIYGDNSEALMYAINFTDNKGYVLVSATKKYYPILAYAEHGQFNANMDGFAEWLQEEKKIIQICSNDSLAKLNKQWIQYENIGYSKVNRTASTREIPNQPMDMNWWWMEFAGDLNTPDYQSDYENQYTLSGELTDSWCCHIDEAKSIFPEGEYIYYEVSEYCKTWRLNEQDALFHFRNFTESSSINPLLVTNWHQGNPYNSKVNKSLGCTTVATAQILNYHQKPNWYNWQEINTYGSDIQGEFFKNLGESLGIDYSTNDSGANLDDMKRVFKNLNYTVRNTTNYSTQLISDNLGNGNPILMTGFSGDTGHAWVCDGYNSHNSKIMMTVYVPNRRMISEDGLYSDYPFEPLWDLYGQFSGGNLYLNHMNWGWSGEETWNTIGDYEAPNGSNYQQKVKCLYVEP